jgi:hypothetical protein
VRATCIFPAHIFNYLFYFVIYDEKTKALAAPVVFNKSVNKSIKDKMRAKENEDRILLDAFT